MQIENKNPNNLIDNPNRLKTHSEEDIALLSKSIQRFGQTRPVVINSELVIQDGHKLNDAFKAMGRMQIATLTTPKEGYGIVGLETEGRNVIDETELKLNEEIADSEDKELQEILGIVSEEEDDEELLRGQLLELIGDQQLLVECPGCDSITDLKDLLTNKHDHEEDTKAPDGFPERD